ncbi:amphi-Trp domain-containing protein [Miltoncostaea marina]|uniref:amphi-Trp domain-containing protein n=1 Tax=Miltoncostaea marina TaxID=2843215 RepID=UPI001C3D8C21|nr:amphi-Trp domain-containing protein [Miltoncostaea marina]
MKHVFDLSETATHELVARQLRDLADQFASGSVDLSYDEEHAPTVVVDPVDVTVDLHTHRHHVELNIRIGWQTADAPHRGPRRGR